MVKVLLLAAILFLGISVFVLVNTLLGPAEQTVQKHDADNGPIVNQAKQQKAVEAVAKSRPAKGPADAKSAPAPPAPVPAQLNQLQQGLEQIYRSEIKASKPPKTEPPKTEPPKTEPPKTNPAKTDPAKTDDRFGSVLPNGLPLWFRTLDTDEDGQVALYEWKASGKSVDEFRRFDRNNDGILTEEEVLRVFRQPIELKFQLGEANYKGDIELSDERYLGQKLSKILNIKLEKGKTYRIDHMSKAFDAYLYLEGPDGTILAQDDDGGEGNNSRIVHLAAKTGMYRIIATSVGGFRGGAFSLSVRLLDAGNSPKGLPAWFKELDTSQDGQIDLNEWRASGKPLDDFRKYDVDGDGLITVEELLHALKTRVDLKFEDGRVEYLGNLEEFTKDRYQGKKSFKILNIKLEKGLTYQFQLMSEAFASTLFLEDPTGKIVAKHIAGNPGGSASIVHRVLKAGMYRIIAASHDGKVGPFALSIQVLEATGGALPKGLPAWFKELDTNRDGQIGLNEWRSAGKPLPEFHQLDLNGDGFITADEIMRQFKTPTELKIQKGQDKKVVIDSGSFIAIESAPKGGGEGKSNGAILANDEKYKGQKLSKTFTVRMEKGKTYQIDLVSQEFSAYLYLEDPEGKLAAKIHSGGKGSTARIVHPADVSGTYRVIATSQEGNKIGTFAISVRMK